MIIYKHTCLSNGKCYIGITVKTIMQRWYEHCSDANRNKKRKFFAAINKYGKENWTHEVLFESEDEQLVLDKEIEFIEKYNSVENGYNTSRDRFRTGIRHTADSIEKMRESQKEKHRRKREEGTEGGWVRKDGGAMLGKEHPNKGGSCANKGKKLGKTWEEIFGVEGAAARREAHRIRRLQKK